MSRGRKRNEGPTPNYAVLNDCGELVWVNEKPDENSPLVQAFWEIARKPGRPADRSALYQILLDAASLGATERTIRDTREFFSMTENDCARFCRSMGIQGKRAVRVAVVGAPSSYSWTAFWIRGTDRPHWPHGKVPTGSGRSLWDALVDLWKIAPRPTR